MAQNYFGKTDSRGSTPVTYNFTPLSSAEPFVTTKPYTVGEYCFYEGVLYRCKTDKAAGAWAPTKFEEANLGEHLTEAEKALLTKAEIDGYYENLGAGTAEQLVSTIFEEDSTPYNFRTSGGSIDIGDRLYDEIVGGTVAWNQLIQKHTSATAMESTSTTGLTISVDSDGYVNISGTPDATCVVAPQPQISSFPANHVGLILCDGYDGSFAWGRGGFTIANNFKNYFMNKHTASFSFIPFMRFVAGTAYNVKVRFAGVDLTAMFGSTIADYIYSLEQGTAGAGVAWFKKLFPKPYYAYNAGELLSVSGLQSHDMVGFNAFDVANADLQQKNWENIYTVSQNVHTEGYTKVIGGATYCFHQNIETQGRYIRFYDADYNWLENDSISIYNNNDYVFTVPTNAVYLRVMWYHANGVSVAEVADGDICINLSWDGERDGEYEEYVKHSYSLDSSLTLRGIPKLDASNNLYYDGDTYESDGTVTRKYATVTLNGTQTAGILRSDTNAPLFQIVVPQNPSAHFDAIIPNIIADKLVTRSSGDIWANDVGGFISSPTASNLRVWVRINGVTTVEQLQAYFTSNPTMVIYELAAPTTEEATPYTNPQIVDDFGTEEYVTTSIVPVGHNTKYQPNLRAKLEMAPNSPDGNGEYIVTQANGENSYTPLASSDVVQGLIARIEALEGTEGGGE